MAHVAEQAQALLEAQMTHRIQVAEAAAFATIEDLPLANLATSDSVCLHSAIIHRRLKVEVARTPWPGVAAEMALESHHEMLY